MEVGSVSVTIVQVIPVHRHDIKFTFKFKIFDELRCLTLHHTSNNVKLKIKNIPAVSCFSSTDSNWLDLANKNKNFDLNFVNNFVHRMWK